jgi:hypothetical protein
MSSYMFGLFKIKLLLKKLNKGDVQSGFQAIVNRKTDDLKIEKFSTGLILMSRILNK